MKLISTILQRARECASYLGSGAAVIEQLSPMDGRILDLQSQQLLEGKRPDGSDIRPYYSEDPYFNEPGRFFHNPDAYKAWKSTNPESAAAWNNPKRKEDAPNLYINGRFHSELGCYFEADGILITGATAYAAGIVRKYGAGTFGLSMERWNGLMHEVLPDIQRRIKQIMLGNG